MLRPKYKSYKVNGEKYTFPDDVNNAKLGDTTGFVDQWPAYSSRRMVSSKSLLLTRQKNLIVLNENETKLPNLTPKPKLLEYMEMYITKQLKRHNVENVEPSVIRLEIYREVFDALTDAFKTYKPLFADIKREYDSMISKLREDIRNLEPMKEMIWTLSEEKNQEVLKIKQHEKEDITKLRSDKIELMKVIAEMDAEHQTLNIQIETLIQKLEEEHLAYRNEADARRLLIIDINDIKQQLTDISMTNKNQEQQSNDDPYIMRLSLDQAKKAHTGLLSEITKMKVDYANVVPRRDFDNLQEEHNQLKNSSEQNSKRVAQLEIEHQLLEERFTALQQQRDFYYTKYMDLARASTPRPEWKKCGEVVNSGPSWWNEQSKDKSSKNMLDLLLHELTMSSSIKEQIEGKGTDNSVLAFLRLSGKVNLRYMPKRDIKIHIREIMEGRKILKEEQIEAISKNREYLLPSMGEYLDLFFKKTYGIVQIRQEWAYTFYESLQKEMSDEKIIQFRKLLSGEIDEDVYWDEMIYLRGIMDMFKAKDLDNKNLISKDDLKAVLEIVIPNNNDEELLTKLMNLILTDILLKEDEQFPYENIFMVNDEGEYGTFINNIRQIFIDKKKKYVEEIEKELRDCGSKITPDHLKSCIQIVDPSIPEEMLEKYVFWSFECSSTDELKKMESTSVDHIVNRLICGAVKRVGPRN